VGRLAEELVSDADVLLEPEHVAHDAEGDAECQVLVLAVLQARAGRVGAEVAADEGADEPVGARGRRPSGEETDHEDPEAQRVMCSHMRRSSNNDAKNLAPVNTS